MKISLSSQKTANPKKCGGSLFSIFCSPFILSLFEIGRYSLPIIFVVSQSGCITTKDSQPQAANQRPNPYVKPLTLPAWLTAPDDRECLGVPVDLEMKTPDVLRPFENRYALPPWMIYGTVRALGMQRMHIEGDVKSYALTVDDRLSEVPEEDAVIYFVPERDIHRALMGIVKTCSEAKNEGELNQKIASYIQCLYEDRYALFTLSPSSEAFGRGASQTLEVFKVGRTDLPVIGWVTTDQFHETTVAAEYNPAYPLESFQQAEELAIRDLAGGVQVKFRSMEQVESVRTNRHHSKMVESAVKESFDLELRGVQVVRRAVDVEQGICLVAVRVPKAGIIVR